MATACKWDDLMFEMKELIIKQSTEKTRRALKLCSVNDRKLVDYINLKTLPALHIGYGAQCGANYHKWSILVYESLYRPHLRYPFNGLKTYNFSSFAEFQTELLAILTPLHSIGWLIIENLNTDLPLKLLSSKSCRPRRRLLVETLGIYIDNGNGEQLENIISQVEPDCLSEIFMRKDEGNSRIYDMQQVIHADVVRVEGSCSIREDQLLKLEARQVIIDEISCSIKKFVKKCACEASTKLPKFRFGGLEAHTSAKKILPLSVWSLWGKKALLKTNHPQLKLEVEISNPRSHYGVEGGVRADSELTASIFSRRGASQFREIREFRISYYTKTRLWYITVRRRAHNENRYKMASAQEAQAKIDEILANTDKIIKFHITLDKSKSSLKWPSTDKKLIVSHLEVYGNNSQTGICQLLPQIDPFFIRSIEISSKEDGNQVDNEIFNLPQIRHSQKVEISGSVLLDEQLLKIKSEHLHTFCKVPSSRSDYGVQNMLLTANGLNKYMKYCLLDADNKCHSFNFESISPDLKHREQELFEDFIVIKSNLISPYQPVKKLITLPGSELVMHVVIHRNCLAGVRQKLNEPIPPADLLSYIKPFTVDELYFDRKMKSICDRKFADLR